ncbi:cytochrome c [Phenylobacterium sp. J367]|uniref:cytochrome c n=1 Tax=Phenylobacterium sp. J367 TaxID=2898435 RepID=UPI002151E92F|nr:cytochrome c [Phenylobacterium sp. J367]MCR5881056.1 cytochrome c [Phenylobacterium sp. J367]
MAFATGCATVPEEPLPPDVAFGKRLAEQHCAGCHGAAPGRTSPHRGAPPFWMLDGLHTPESLQHSVADSGRHTLYGMPSVVITRGEAAAILAYMDAVATADAATARRLDMPPCVATAC